MKFIKWFLSLFKKDSNTPSVENTDMSSANQVEDTTPIEPTPTPVEDTKIPVKIDTRIAIIVGHTPKAQGAVNYKGESEFRFNSRIAEKIKSIMFSKYPNKEVKIFFRQEGDYSAAVTRVGRDVGLFKAGVSLELHFNSYHTVAYGCEILVWEGSKNFKNTVKVADEITDRIAEKFNLRERGRHNFPGITVGDGVKILATKDRGALNIKACNDNGVTHAMLIEPCFANKDTAESRAIFENEDKYAEFLADELGKITV